MNSIFITSLILISEIMFDPDPQVGLPPFEYVEWYNPGADTIDLTGWQWMVGDKVRRLSGGHINPGGYVIVCSPSAASAFRTFGDVVALESFPSLRNSGDRLVLLNPEGIAVHTVDYSPDAFTDALKANGGWSLELTDPINYCNALAWQPSVDPAGGTPGKANSQSIEVPETDVSMLLRAGGYDDQRFFLMFSGILDPANSMNNYSCSLMPGEIIVTRAAPPEYGFPGLFFQIPAGLDPGMIYTLEVNGNVKDCSGRNALVRPVLLGFPTKPDSADLIISEVLFDPLAGQSEFVEIFNRSQKVIELGDLILARADLYGNIIAFSDQQDLSYWLFPGCFAVFTADARMFSKAWPDADAAATAGRTDMPSLTNEESMLILMDAGQRVLDRVIYSPDWHYAYLEETKGVSLERIDFQTSGSNRENWLSASAASGFCTPGAKNSTASGPAADSKQQFYLDPTVGYSANLNGPVQVAVRYRFDEPGWFIRVNIVTSQGLPVKEIFPFGMAGAEGTIIWDGLDTGQRIVTDGIYLVVADYYHPTGKKGRWKRACAVLRNY
jgi:hypothetical protein